MYKVSYNVVVSNSSWVGGMWGGERDIKVEGISESDIQRFTGNVSSILEIIV
jgi:hypothetical protein